MADIESEPLLRQDEIFARARCGDLQIMAETILDARGYDRSNDRESLWEADWALDDTTGITLSREVGEDGRFVYYLEVIDAAAADNASDIRGFNPSRGSVGWGADGAELNTYYWDSNPIVWRSHERELHRLLRTAPVSGLDRLPLDSRWEQVFETMMLWIAAEDREVIQYVNKYDPLARDVKGRRRERHETLKTKHGLSDEQFGRVIEMILYGEPNSEEAYGQG